MAWYRVGTVNVTNGSKNVVGVGTDWLSLAGTAQVSNSFVGPDGRMYEVGMVLGGGSLKLVEDYAGATLAAQPYAIMPTMGLTAELARQVGLLIQQGTAGLAIKGVKGTYEELLAVSGSAIGDAWVVGTGGEGRLYVQTGSEWYDLGSVGVTPELQAARDEAVDAKGVAVAAAGSIVNRLYPNIYTAPPSTKPDGTPCTEGDECWILTESVPRRYAFLGGAWTLALVDGPMLLAGDGATRMNWQRDADGAGIRSAAQQFAESRISLAEFQPKGDGTDDSLAFNCFAAAILALTMAMTPGQMLKADIPPSPYGDWKVDGPVLFNGSGVEYNITGDITQLSTDRTDTLVFAYDLNNQPAQPISRVRVIFQPDVVIDGNGPAMSFPYTPGDGSANTSSVRFNYVDGFYTSGVHATNGPLDSMSIRQSRGVAENFKATYSKGFAPYLGNGFSVTTDWDSANWSPTNPFTWCDVVVRRCESYGNCSVGITAFNATHVRFEDCLSHDNYNLYSYEKQAGVNPTKFRGGSFVRCGGFNATAGVAYYVNDMGITLDPGCWSRGITGVAGDTNKIFGNNVLVASANECVVGGHHTDAENANVAIFGGTGIPLAVTIGATLEHAGTYNIYSRGASLLRVLSETKTDTSGSTAIYAKNTGGSGYWEGTTNPLGASVAILDSPYIANAGASAFQADGVAEVYTNSIRGKNNCALNAANTGIAILIKNCATIARVIGSVLPEAAGKQGYLVVAEGTAALLQEYANRGGATIARVLNNAAASEPFTVTGGASGNVQTFRAQNTSGATGASVSTTWSVSPDSTFVGASLRSIRTDTVLGNSAPNAHKVAMGAFGAGSFVEFANWTAYGLFVGNGTTDPRSWMDIGKSFGIRPLKVTTSGTVDSDRSVFEVDATAGNLLLTINDPRVMDGRFNEFIRIDGSANTVSIQLDAAVISAGCAFSDGTTTPRTLTRAAPQKFYAAATDKLWLIA